jgi:membrane protein implicated in regulation of membrane protease activity
VLGVAELLTTTFALGLIAVAALVAAVVGAFHLGLPFSSPRSSSRPAPGSASSGRSRRRHIKQPPLLRTGTAALVGRSAIVLEEVTEHGGRVRIGGEEWSARPTTNAGHPGRLQGRRHADRGRHRPRLPTGVAMVMAELIIAAVVALLVC